MTKLTESSKAFHGNELPLYEKNNLSIIPNDYELVVWKSPTRHSGEGRSPQPVENTGLRPAPQ